MLLAAVAVLSTFQSPPLPLGYITIKPTSESRETITLSCDNICRGEVHRHHQECTLSCDKVCDKKHDAVLVPEFSFNPSQVNRAMNAFGQMGEPQVAWLMAQGMVSVRTRLSDELDVSLDHWNETACSAMERRYGLRKHLIQTATASGGVTIGEAWLPEVEPLVATPPSVTCLCDDEQTASALDDCLNSTPSLAVGPRESELSYPSGGVLISAHRYFETLPKGIKLDWSGVDLGNVNFSVTNDTDQPVAGSVLAGTRLFPSDPMTQQMAISGTTPFRVGPGATQMFTAPALCLEMDKKEPDSTVFFVPQPLNDDHLAAIIEYTDKSSFRGPWDQARLWTVTDGANLDEINKRLFPPVPAITFGRALCEIGRVIGPSELIRVDLFEGISEADRAEFILSGLGANNAPPALLDAALDLAWAGLGILGDKETSERRIERGISGASSLVLSANFVAQTAGVKALGQLENAWPTVYEGMKVEETLLIAIVSSNSSVRGAASAVTRVPAPEFTLSTALQVGRVDPVSSTGLDLAAMNLSTTPSPKLLGIQFLEPEILAAVGGPGNVKIDFSPVRDAIGFFTSSGLPHGKPTMVFGVSAPDTGQIGSMLQNTSPGLTNISTCVISSDGEMAKASTVIDIGDTLKALEGSGPNGSAAAKQLRESATALKAARTKLAALLKEQRRLRRESVQTAQKTHQLSLIDKKYVDDIESIYRGPIDAAIAENAALKAGQIQPDPAKLAADLAAAQKAFDDCDKLLKALKARKAALEAKRDQLKRETDALMAQADAIFHANGYDGKNGYHANGHYWWGYHKPGGGMPQADSLRISSIRRQLRQKNREYMDTLRELPPLERGIAKKEIECAKRKKELDTAQTAKDKSDQIGANDGKIDAAADDIDNRLDEAGEALGDDPEFSDLEDQIGDVRSAVPEGAEGWDQFWKELQDFIAAKKAKEKELKQKAKDLSGQAGGIGVTDIPKAREELGAAEDDFNTAKKLAGHAASADVKKITDQVTTEKPRSGKWAPVSVGTTRGHCEDGELRGGHTKYDYYFEGPIPGVTIETGDDGKKKKPDCPADLVIYVHGFNNTDAESRENLDLVSKTLKQSGYDGPMIGWTWDSDTGALSFDDSKAHSVINGSKLAAFIRDYKKVCPETRIRLIGHSQGCRLILESLKALHSDAEFSDWRGDGHKVETVHLMGAAVDNEEIQTDYNYGKAVENQAGHCTNYWNDEDDILSDLYFPEEGDQALGENNIEDASKAPKNFSSRDVKSEISTDTDGDGEADESNAGDNHSGYAGVQDKNGKVTSDGCMDLVVKDFNIPK
jgi:hypothetical protein